jgi:hypothetical protein
LISSFENVWQRKNAAWGAYRRQDKPHFLLSLKSAYLWRHVSADDISGHEMQNRKISQEDYLRVFIRALCIYMQLIAYENRKAALLSIANDPDAPLHPPNQETSPEAAN